MATAGEQRISRDDLENAFADAIGEVETEAKAVVPQVVVLAVAVAVAVITLAYLAGRRRGTKRSAVVEIHRV